MKAVVTLEKQGGWTDEQFTLHVQEIFGSFMVPYIPDNAPDEENPPRINVLSIDFQKGTEAT